MIAINPNSKLLPLFSDEEITLKTYIPPASKNIGGTAHRSELTDAGSFSRTRV